MSERTNLAHGSGDAAGAGWVSVVPPLAVHAPVGDLSAGCSEIRELEGWWLALLWVTGPDGSPVLWRDVASTAGPPADPPLARLGPSVSGALSGWILEEDGRQQLRLRLGVAPADPARPWEAPLVVVAGFRWEPMRAATSTRDQLATLALTAFRDALGSLARR